MRHSFDFLFFLAVFLSTSLNSITPFLSTFSIFSVRIDTGVEVLRPSQLLEF